MFSFNPIELALDFIFSNKFPSPAIKNSKSFLFSFNFLIISNNNNGLFCSEILQINPITYFLLNPKFALCSLQLYFSGSYLFSSTPI